jgi:hypothetical protein
MPHRCAKITVLLSSAIPVQKGKTSRFQRSTKVDRYITLGAD